MAHLGLTPQSVHAFGGYRVQGRGEDGDELLADAKALEAAGAFAVVLEVVPADLAARVTASLSRSRPSASAPAPGPTRRCSCGRTWPASPRGPPGSSSSTPTCTALLGDAVRDWAADVVDGAYPGPEHTYH